MKTLYRIFNGATQILAGNETGKNKRRLIMAYLRLTLKYSLLAKMLGLKIKNEKVMGFDVTFFEYSTFRNLFNEMFVFREYEFLSADPAPLIIDCGSNIGLSVLYFKHRYPRARIVGFEPDAKTFAVLQKNVFDNKLADVRLHQTALSGQEGAVTFYSEQDRAGSPGMSLTARLTEKDIKISAAEVIGARLSGYIEEPVDLLKLDVEGSELEVVRDLCETSKIDLVSEMFIEYHFNRTNPTNKLGELLTLLERASFKYVLKAPCRAPFYTYREKAYDLIVYAYR